MITKENKSIEKITSFSTQDFLNFLKITYQVHESIIASSKDENKNKNNETINYNQLANNVLVNSFLSTNLVQSPKTNDSDSNENQLDKNLSESIVRKHHYRRSKKSADSEKLLYDSLLTDKLTEIINEGILDSILPFICSMSLPQNNKAAVNHTCNNKNKSLVVESSPNCRKNSQTTQKQTENHNSFGTIHRDRSGRRKSSQSINNSSDHEVMIHVCDEVKNVSQDFSCPQKLLISKMGYFADITTSQRLEDMDISVHCDLQIFEWLIRWVKKELMSQEMWPILDQSNVVPILVSAGFLQMEPLLVDCLAYCHANLTDVVKASANLSCLNDSIISRLAAMFTNLELEMVKDKKERVTPRLWIKLIQSLCEPEPQALRGHFGSLSDLFRCNRCFKCLNATVSSYIHCLPYHMRLNRYGQVVSHHNRDLAWNMNNFISSLHKDLKSWRRVYWRLWGNCHYLYCATCETHFPVYQMNWCLYHPEQPQFLGPITEGRMAGPTGRYPCCGQQAYRYETLSGPTGCQYREHTIQIFTDRDQAILKLAQIAAEGNCLYETPSMKLLNISANTEAWWNEIILTPQRDRQGLLLYVNDEENYLRSGRKTITQTISFDSSSETESSGIYRNSKLLQQFSTTSSDGCESDISTPRPVRPKQRPIPNRKPKPTGRYWCSEMSARSNQDNQREFEERALKQIISTVKKKIGFDVNNQSQTSNTGGSYVFLETEWRDRHRQNKLKHTKQ